jgi:hypothetical protein
LRSVCVGKLYKKDFRFRKPTVGRTGSLERFNIINHFLEKNEINWENCNGLCIEGAKLMSGLNAGLQTLVRRKSPYVMWTHGICVNRYTTSEELQTVVHAAVTVVNYIKNSPLREDTLQSKGAIWRQNTQ